MIFDVLLAKKVLCFLGLQLVPTLYNTLNRNLIISLLLKNQRLRLYACFWSKLPDVESSMVLVFSKSWLSFPAGDIVPLQT